MSGTNTYKEYLQHNEKKRNAKNIVLVPRQIFDPCQNYMDPRHPSHPRQNFNLRHFLLTHVTHATHTKISTTPPRNLGNQEPTQRRWLSTVIKNIRDNNFRGVSLLLYLPVTIEVKTMKNTHSILVRFYSIFKNPSPSSLAESNFAFAVVS